LTDIAVSKRLRCATDDEARTDNGQPSEPELCQPGEAFVRVAYLVNQHPLVSTTFIRRELLALERLGVEVERIALRGWDHVVPDLADKEEQSRTRYVLKEGVRGLIGPVLRAIVSAPKRFLSALGLTIRMSRHSELPYWKHLAYLAEACRVAGWLRASGADHLHAHFGTNSAEVAMLAHELGGPPFSFTVHGPEEFDSPRALGLPTMIARAAFVVAISSFTRSQLFRWASHEDWTKIKVVHAGIDASFARIAPSPPSGSNRLVCVGRICEQKGQLLALEAAALLRERGIDFELVLAGDGDMRNQADALIAKLDLSSVVHITGWLDGAGVRQQILAARALVLPSFAEGLPVVIMEAMALYRPVISTFVGAIPELVLPGQTGWLVPSGDAHLLAAAMVECFNSAPQDLVRMGEAAFRRVMARHDVDHEATKLHKLFADA
jgi:colanic acid/amylovoran biosynthesis glycosyltransferase